MADKYWVGPGGSLGNPTSGNFSSTGAWRTTSGGATTTTTPGTSDVAIFDNNSVRNGNITVTVTATTTVGSIDATAITTAYTGTLSLAGSSNMTISNAPVTVTGILLPAARFVWSNTGTVTMNGLGRLDTKGARLGCNLTISSTSAIITLDSNGGCANFTQTAGALTLNGFRLTCNTYAATGGSSASINGTGEIEVTATSGTVINVTKTTTTLSIANQAGLTLILSGDDGGISRTIVFSATSWATSTVTMPRLRITNGSGSVSINHSASGVSNLYSYDSTGFTGTFGYINRPVYVYIYGSFISPTNTWGAGPITAVFLRGFSALFAAIAPGVAFYKDPAYLIEYTQAGPIQVGTLSSNADLLSPGYFILNNTGDISGNIYLRDATLIGNVSFGAAGGGTFQLREGNISGLTSITKTASAYTFNFQFGGLSDEVPITFPAGVSFTFNNNSETSTIEWYNVTVNGTVTYAAPLDTIRIYGSTFANPVNVTSREVVFNNTVNIPSTSVINISSSAGSPTYLTLSSTAFTNKFRVNVSSISTSGVAAVLYGTVSYVVNAPDVYISGTGPILFGDPQQENGYYPSFSLLDMSAYTGSSPYPDNVACIRNSIVKGANLPSLNVTLYPSATGTFTLNSLSLGTIFFNSTQTVDVVSPTLTLGPGGSTVSSGILKLNNCTLSLNSSTSLERSGTGVINAGTSTINLPSNGTLYALDTDFYNVNVAGSGTAVISARFIQNLTNTVQPTTVRFNSNVIFGNFALNGTAGNLVTVQGISTRKTLTKGTPWTLGNSTDSGSNTGITFLTPPEVGNNNYIDMFNINGVYVPVAAVGTSSAFFAFF